MLRAFSLVLTILVAVVMLSLPVSSQVAKARITKEIDNSELQSLPHNVHRLARSEYDRGSAPADLSLDRMLLVLTPSADRQAALAQLLSAQQDKSSPQYHKWLTPQQFGEQFGVADSDIAKVSSWLQSQGFQVNRVANAKTIIEFSGNAGQLAHAFHTEMHQFSVKGNQHWANASNPKIPSALASVVAGISTLHNFRKASQIALKMPQVAKLSATGSRVEFTAGGNEYALSPGDFATIYNINPVYQNGVTGSGTTIAVVARSNIHVSDIADFRSAFGLSTNQPQIIINGTDPGIVSGDEDEAVLDASWSGAIASGATVDLVVSQSTNTTDGVDLSEEYIVDNNLADVMTESYGDCEANYTQAEAQFYSSLAQQAAAEGITYTVAAGDSGAEGCDDPDSETAATGPVSVNILASTQYDIAVGGTQFNENGNYNVYWSSTTSADGVSALSYIPENVWNESCSVAQCGNSDASIYAGSGGASTLVGKPSWQTGVTGIPSDNARDVPDVAMTSASHDFYLLCLDGSCTQRRGGAYFSGISGTSASTPSFAGIMALIVQNTGSRQGQADPKLYSLAATENLAYCNGSSLTSSPVSSCIFNDVTTGNNAVPGEAGYGSSAADYQAGGGYDLATGLGSVNVNNLVYEWSGATATTPTSQVRIGIDSPSSTNSTVAGQTTFSGWALADTGTVTAVNISVDSVPISSAGYGTARTDVCADSSSANCPNVGWNLTFDTTTVANGAHTLDVTAVTSSGQIHTASSAFTVANWSSSNPMMISIDSPSAGSAAFSGTAYFGGWAVDSLSAVSEVTITVDGVSYGAAQYGSSRTDVCALYPDAGCPNVGWNFALDTTRLADGTHTLAVTTTTAGGQHSTKSQTFSVSNNPGNVITLAVDQPGSQSTTVSGGAGFGGWAIGTSVPVSTIAITIDGAAYGNAIYGGDRSDVCSSHPGRPSCPDVGWNFSLDTTLLVNGLHILGVKAYTNTGQYTATTRTFTVYNGPSSSPVLIGIDSPSSANSIVTGVTSFSGWAITNGLGTAASLGSVAIAIDGVAYGTATYGSSRPDVCTVYPGDAKCPNVGWTFSIDTTTLADGLHTMTATATGIDVQGTLSSTFTVANWTTSNPMRLSIDYPNSQTGSLSGSVGIGGWAIDQLSAVSKVSVAVDGLSLGTASYGGTRSDVCSNSSFSGSIGCPNIGWNFFLDTRLLSDGTHTLAVTGTTAGGQSSTFTTTFQVANQSSETLLVDIDTPAANQTGTGIVAVNGWAISTTGAQVLTADVLVDGVLNGVAAYGVARPDVCAVYSHGGGCPNVGYGYQFNSSVYANGSHTLEVRVTAADGSEYTASTTFNVANQP